MLRWSAAAPVAFVIFLVGCGDTGGAPRSPTGAGGGSATSGGSSSTSGGSTETGGSGSAGAATSGSSGLGGSAAGSAGTVGGAGMPSTCSDACTEPSGGLQVGCRKRFLYGMNYAYVHFGADFGGISSWGQPGISGSVSEHTANLTSMRSHQVRLVRWWLYPDFRGDGVTFASGDVPSGLGGTAVADIGKALELASQTDVYLMLTLFSFDAFRPSQSVSDRWVPSLHPIVQDASKRQALVENVIRAVAKTAAQSPHASRLFAWDVINEPEWALSGSDAYGDPAFDPINGLATISHAEMEGFLSEAIAVLRSESNALVTLGGASLRWAKAWNGLDLDFYQLHRYEDSGFSFDSAPSDFGLAKPAMFGEFPLQGLAGMSYDQTVTAWHDHGWAGALSYQFDWATETELTNIAAFGGAHACAIDLAP